MEAACIPESVQVEESFDFKDDATFEAFVQHMLVHKQIVDGVDQASWSFHPLCGQLRNLWKRLSKQGIGSVAVATLSPAASAAGAVQQPASSCAESLSVVERDRLRRELEKKYTGALITERILPCMSLLNMIHAQKLQGAWEWISWKKLLSEQAACAVKGHRSCEAKDRFVEALVQGAGLCEEQWDKELPAAPFQVQALLQVRSFAFAMVGACHLGSWNLYVPKFMDFYTADPGEHFRFPTVQEAEQAD